jgi:hypothetical protein
MGSPNYFGRWKQNWDFLIAEITAATAHGQSLDGIKTITRTEFSAVELLPAIGCQLKKTTWEIIGMNTRRVTQLFSITAALQVDQNDATPDTGTAAVNALVPFLNDGTGNGLEPFLNALGPQTGQWQRSMIVDMEFDVIQDATQNATAIAYARFLFETVDQTKGGG